MTSNPYEAEQKLIEACINGDELAWKKFQQTYKGVILHAIAYVKARYDVSDLNVDDASSFVYEGLLANQCRALRAFGDRAKFTTYLTSVVRNRTIDFVRKLPKREVVAEDKVLDYLEKTESAERPSSIEDREIQTLQRAELLRAIEGLESKERMALKLRLKGLSQEDIAKAMGIPKGTVAVKTSRAIKKLRKALGGSDLFDEGVS